MCQHKVQRQSLVRTYDNKSTYTQYKNCISTLLLNVRHDAVSGWLMGASLFYKNKQYKIALDVLKYSLLKCSKEKLYRNMCLSDINYEMFSLNLFRQMNIAQLKQMLSINEVLFFKNSTLLPDEFRIIEETLGYVVPPVVYAHSIRFLCHYHLNNSIQCQHSLKDLQLIMEKDYFISDDSVKALSYNILGISFLLERDIKSAEQAFMKSVELFPEVDFNSAFRMLSLLKSATQDASISLYHYMCQKIVGTKEHITKLRVMNTVRDNLSKYEDRTTITSGSAGEGLRMRGSDIDIMILLMLIEITIGQLSKLLMVNKVWFFEKSPLLSDAFKIVDTSATTQPVVYAHFLSFLCQYHQNNIIQCQHYLQDLQSTIEEDYFIANAYEKVLSYNIIDVTLLLLGDIEKARQAFEKSEELFPNPDLNSESHRLSILDSMQLC
ncbi:unnamed protein product [Mytilus coruscus]|uniref:Uncharacterized protein n=1 Tax=Mytilus coruscus TaxID=42192 RepID=A0A6J8B027_MYTCO|nr:unnamed protein product [Mytilus coruscus]